MKTENLRNKYKQIFKECISIRSPINSNHISRITKINNEKLKKTYIPNLMKIKLVMKIKRYDLNKNSLKRFYKIKKKNWSRDHLFFTPLTSDIWARVRENINKYEKNMANKNDVYNKENKLMFSLQEYEYITDAMKSKMSYSEIFKKSKSFEQFERLCRENIKPFRHTHNEHQEFMDYIGKEEFNNRKEIHKNTEGHFEELRKFILNSIFGKNLEKISEHPEHIIFMLPLINGIEEETEDLINTLIRNIKLN